jgi:hypothetical protein
LSTATSKEKVTAEQPKSKKTKKPATAVPGLPDLPPGVDLPPEVEALVKKALQDAKKKPAVPKKTDK